MKFVKWLMPVVAVSFALAACSSNQNASDGANAGGQTGGGAGSGTAGGYPGSSGVNGTGYPGSGGAHYSDMNGGPGGYDGAGAGGYDANLLNQRVIYFEFDSSRIRSQDMAVIVAHARHLAKQPGRTVRLEGHADERGSREYNVALSLRRADAVARVMEIEGANATLKPIGYGEEMPAVLGHSEAAWSKNRRVEIKY
jgi:peptidoglycan-associated lipoprotein